MAMLSGMSGCFYLDSINQRPGAQIALDNADAQKFRDDPVTAHAVTSDPEGDTVSYLWRAYACGEWISALEDGCDPLPYATGALEEFPFSIANLRADGAAPPTNIKLDLQVTDEYGAVALPRPRLFIPVVGRIPTLELQAF